MCTANGRVPPYFDLSEIKETRATPYADGRRELQEFHLTEPNRSQVLT